MQLKVARNGNWVMSTKVLGGEDPRTTRKYRSVSLEKRGFSDRHSAIDDFSFFLRWTNRENAWRGRLGKMWSTLTLEQGSRREDIEPASPEAELPHQVSMETWHSLSGFSSFSSCSSFSSLLWLLSLFLSLSLSLPRRFHSPRASAPQDRRVASEDRPRLQRTIFPVIFLKPKGKIIWFRGNWYCSPGQFLFSSFILPWRRFSFRYLRYWIISEFQTLLLLAVHSTDRFLNDDRTWHPTDYKATGINAFDRHANFIYFHLQVTIDWNIFAIFCPRVVCQYYPSRHIVENFSVDVSIAPRNLIKDVDYRWSTR